MSLRFLLSLPSSYQFTLNRLYYNICIPSLHSVPHHFCQPFSRFPELGKERVTVILVNILWIGYTCKRISHGKKVVHHYIHTGTLTHLLLLMSLMLSHLQHIQKQAAHACSRHTGLCQREPAAFTINISMSHTTDIAPSSHVPYLALYLILPHLPDF